MYNEKIENLISAALADGVLTEKEKQVLFKKAHELGIDLDEFEMVLDARLFEAENKAREKRAKAAPQSDKYADVKKCPACGCIIPPNTKVCPGCGMVFNNEQSDIKEVLLLQDNYVKINEFYAKFPLGPIYIAMLILVTLFNIFAWVYAISLEDLVGLPVLSTIVWIGALIAFFVVEKTYFAFPNSYDKAIAEHSKLLSTAKGFYAQDKDTLNRIGKIADEVEAKITSNTKIKNTYNYISFGVLGLTVILSFILSFGWFNNVLIRNDYSRCYSAVQKAIKANNMDKAEAYYNEFNDYGHRSIALQIMCAYIEQDNEEKVKFYYSLARENDSYGPAATIANYYIAQDKHQSAVDAISEYTYGEIECALHLCVLDYMKKGKRDDALKLIKTNSYLFNGAPSNNTYYKPKVVKRLNDLTRQ